MKKALDPRNGFTLIEMILVMGALVGLMALGSAAVAELLKVRQAASKSHDRLVRFGDLADQFRTDVGEATGAPRNFDGVQAGAACLILKRADGGHLTYRWDDGKLERSVIAAGKTTRSPFLL